MLKKSYCSHFITLDCCKKSDKPKVWNVQYLTNNFYPMETTLLPPSVKCEPITLQQHVIYFWVFGLKLINGRAFSMHVVVNIG